MLFISCVTSRCRQSLVEGELHHKEENEDEVRSGGVDLGCSSRETLCPNRGEMGPLQPHFILFEM